ncbi:MAG: hypothetical protein KDK39_14030 [Leptospiraceae bacterium]|nr:hypothetical protein [Leptospiraceae bacterium]
MQAARVRPQSGLFDEQNVLAIQVCTWSVYDMDYRMQLILTSSLAVLLLLLWMAPVLNSCKGEEQSTDDVAAEIEDKKEDIDPQNQVIHKCNEHSSKTCVILTRCAFTDKRPAKLQECLAEARIQASCKRTADGLCCDECDQNSCVSSCTLP